MMGFKHFGVVATIKTPYSRVGRWENRTRAQQKRDYDREQGKAQIYPYGKRRAVQKDE